MSPDKQKSSSVKYDIFEVMPVPLQSLDVDARIVQVNEHWLNLLGYTKKEVTGKWFGDFLSKDHIKTFEKNFKNFKKAGKACNIPLDLKSKQGHIIHASFDGSIVFTPSGEIDRTFCVLKDISSEIEYNQKLIESEEKFRHFFEANADMCYIFSNQGKVLDVNQKTLQTIGYTKDEVIGTNIFDEIIDESSREYARKLLDNYLQTGVIRNKEITINSKKGDKIIVLLNVDAVRNESGEVEYATSTQTDITHRKKAEKDLENAERKFRTIANYTYDWEFWMSQDRSYRYISPSAERISGYAPQEFMEDPNLINQIILDDDRLIWENHFCEKTNQQDDSSNIVQFRIKRRDGAIRWIEHTCQLIYDDHDNCLGHRGSNRDITEKKNAEIEIQRQNERLESILNISQLDVESFDTLFDQALQEAFKLTSSQDGFIFLYNEHKRELRLMAGSEKLITALELEPQISIIPLKESGFLGEAILNRKSIVRNEGLYKQNGQGEKWVKKIHIQTFLSLPVVVANEIVAVIGLANKDGEYEKSDINQLTLLMDSVWNIVEKQTYMQEVIEAKEKAIESDQLKSAFLANMSHELRTPMNSIIGFSELISKPTLSPDKRKHFASIIDSSCQDLLSLVNDILDISKIETGQTEFYNEEVNVNDLLTQLFAIHKPRIHGSGISLFPHKGLPDDECFITTDRQKLEQIFNNLINNAFKFTQTGHIKYGYELKGDYLEFYVEDTGMGIKENQFDNIFERFRQADLELTREFGGTGLGLSICKNFVELLGGEIWVKSEISKGSTFFFTIPFDRKYLKSAQTKRRKDKSNDNVTVLIAEDDEVNYLFLEELLADFNFSILHAKTGAEAVDICRQLPYISLILMDIKMPDMNGLEATRKIKEIRPEIPIVVQTAFAMEADEQRAKNYGCDEYISKPIDQDRFLGMIKKYLNNDE